MVTTRDRSTDFAMYFVWALVIITTLGPFVIGFLAELGWLS